MSEDAPQPDEQTLWFYRKRDRRRRPSKETKPENEPPLWNTSLTARHLGVSTGTLRRWRAAGVGPPARKLGNLVRYRPADVHAWVEER